MPERRLPPHPHTHTHLVGLLEGLVLELLDGSLLDQLETILLDLVRVMGLRVQGAEEGGREGGGGCTVILGNLHPNHERVW